MATVPHLTASGNLAASYAHLDDVHGVALRTPERRVFFQSEVTGTWQELFDVDIPRLTMHGDVALADAQRLADGPGYTWVIRRNTEHARAVA
jgi:hypothetical protein